MTIDDMPVLDEHTTFKEHLKGLAILSQRLRASNKVACKLMANLPTMGSDPADIATALEISRMVANESETLSRVLWKVVNDMFAMQGWKV